MEGQKKKKKSNNVEEKKESSVNTIYMKCGQYPAVRLCLSGQSVCVRLGRKLSKLGDPH